MAANLPHLEAIARVAPSPHAVCRQQAHNRWPTAFYRSPFGCLAPQVVLWQAYRSWRSWGHQLFRFWHLPTQTASQIYWCWQAVESQESSQCRNKQPHTFRISQQSTLDCQLFFSKGIDSRKFERPSWFVSQSWLFIFHFARHFAKNGIPASPRKKTLPVIATGVCVCVRNPVSQGNACPVLTFPCSLFHLWFHVIIIDFAQRNKERQEKQSVPTLLGLGILMRKPSRASETAKRQRQISFIFIPASV